MIISMKSAAIVNVHLRRDTRWSMWMSVFFITIMADSIPGAQNMILLSGCVGKDAVGVSCMLCRKTPCLLRRFLLLKRSTAKAMIMPSVTGTFSENSTLLDVP